MRKSSFIFTMLVAASLATGCQSSCNSRNFEDRANKSRRPGPLPPQSPHEDHALPTPPPPHPPPGHDPHPPPQHH